MSQSKELTTLHKDVKAISAQKNGVLQLLKEAMHEGLDYGNIPGTEGKSLFAPGADKLSKFLRLAPTYETEAAVEDFDKPFFYYRVRCILLNYDTQKIEGSAVKVCHSKERKYTKLNKDQMLDKVNTIISMAEKRAFVAAIRTAAMAREIFKESYDVDELTGEIFSEEDAEPNEQQMALKRLFAIAGERGFSAEGIKKSAYAKFNVDSMTKLNLEQLDELCSSLVATFVEVGRGNKPQRIEPKVEPMVTVEPSVNTGELDDREEEPLAENVTIEPEDEPIVGEVVTTKEPMPTKQCLKCHQFFPISNFLKKGFCNDCAAKLPQNQPVQEALV